MVWGHIKIFIGFCLLFVTVFSVGFQPVFAQQSSRGPLQGTHTQTGGHNCAPTGIGVLADTADVTTQTARQIASTIGRICGVNSTSGTTTVETVWALIRGVLNVSNRTGGTTPGRNITITIGGSRTFGAGYNITVNLTGKRHVDLIYVGVPLNASSLNATLGGSTPGSSGSGGGNGCGGGCGWTPIGVGYKSAYLNEGHFVIIISIDMSEPITRPFGPNGSPVSGYSVVYWDPITNKYTTGWVSAAGDYFDDGIHHGKLKDTVTIK